MNIPKNRIIILLVLIVVIFVFWRMTIKSNDGQLSAPIQKGPIIESVYGIGAVKANHAFQFKSGVISTISKIAIQEGDFVEAGSLLLTIDNNIAIKSPFDGVVTALPFKEGENIFPQTIVVEVVDLSERYLVVSLEQRGALRVQKGQTAKISFDGLREETFEGIVESVYSSENDFLVRINISNLPAQILPGMTADTAIGIKERKDVLLVPVAAIENGFVYVAQGAGQKKVAVKTGIMDGIMAEVIEGDLQEGDRLLIRKRAK